MKVEDTRITRIYNGKTADVINNEWIRVWEKASMSTLLHPLQGLLIAEAQEGLRKMGLTGYLSGYAGQIYGMIKEVRSAKQVVDDMVKRAIRILKGTFLAEVVTSSTEE